MREARSRCYVSRPLRRSTGGGPRRPGQGAPEDALQAARLQYVLANIEFQDHRFDAALAACEAIDELIRPCGVDDDPERVDLWVHMQTNVEFSVHFWRNELERAAAVIESVRPLVESGLQRAGRRLLPHRGWRSSTYVSGATGSTPRSSKITGGQSLSGSGAGTGHRNGAQREPAVLRTEQPRHGADLAWRSRRGSGGTRAGAGERGADGWAGSPRRRGLVELAVNALRRGDVEVVRELASQAREAAAAGG